MDALVADGLTKSYGDTLALNDVSVSVAEGDVFALVGPNAAGKTTFVRCLTGTTPPDAGTVDLLGTPPKTVDKDRIGVLPQEFSPPGRLSARELLTYFGGLYDRSKPVDDVLEAVGLVEAASTRYDRLSGGQRRRVCVGSALVNDPDILFLDEPTTGIDPAGRRAVWTLLEGLAATGTTVFLTTHYMDEAQTVADRVGLLVGGELLIAETPEAIIEAHGGSPRLHVSTSDSVEIDNRRVERVSGGAIIHDVSPADIADVIEELETAGVTYDALSWEEPDLERAYLNLAGTHGLPAETGEQG